MFNNLSLKIGQGWASVMSVNHNIGLPSIQWRASNSATSHPARNLWLYIE